MERIWVWSAFARNATIARLRSMVIQDIARVFLLLLVSVPAYAQTRSQNQAKEPLGSLTSVGEVFVNDSAAPAESTIFAGDRLRTGDTGTATFSISGKGTMKIASRSEVVFVGSYEFTAELKSGNVALSAVSGPNSIVLRVENFVLVPSFHERFETTKVEQTANDAFLVSCLDGGVGVLTLEAKSGQFLQAGQSLSISAGRMITTMSSEKRAGGHEFHNMGWLYLGLGGAGAAGAAAALGHSGKQSVSPSTP